MEESTPVTLCIDIGATSTKGCLVDGAGVAVSTTVSRRTTYPLAPEGLIATITAIAERLDNAQRVAVGFPGMVRGGRVVSASNLAREAGVHSAVSRDLVAAWSGFDLAGALTEALGLEVRVANDADVAALGCSQGTGVELTVTLGSGVGTGLVADGHLMAHLEFSEITLEGTDSLDWFLGEATRRDLEPIEWDRRVAVMLRHLDAIIAFDWCWITGGNARRLRRDALGDLLERVTVVAEPVGLLGGVRLFLERERHTDHG